MVREGGREEEVLQWFVSVLQRAAGIGRDGKSGDGMGCSSSGGRIKELARRMKSEGRGQGGEEGEGGKTGVKRNATLVLVASSLALLYVAVGGGGGGREFGGNFAFPLPPRADVARANLKKASEGAWRALKEGMGIARESVGMAVEYAEQWRARRGGRGGGGRG